MLPFSRASADPHYLARLWKQGIFSSAAEIYRRQTRQVIDRFLDHRITFPDCIAALNAALADFMSRFKPDQLVAVRALMLANNEIVMKEMERRGPQGA